MEMTLAPGKSRPQSINRVDHSTASELLLEFQLPKNFTIRSDFLHERSERYLIFARLT